MKITGPRSAGAAPSRPKRASRGTQGSGFSLQAADEMASAPRAGTAAPVGAVEGVFALQEVPDATDDRSRGFARGHDVLDRLEEIRLAVLGGAVPRDKLVELRQRVQARRRAEDDARLAAILDEIDQRAAVELAKLGMM